MGASIMPVAERDPSPEAGRLPTRREITVIAVMLAVVIASVLLLIVASSRLAATFSSSG